MKKDSPIDFKGYSSVLSKLFGATLAGFALGFKYVTADFKRNKRNVAVGITTIALSVTFVCLLKNAIEHSPVVFLRLAETKIGEYDILLNPRMNVALASGGFDTTGGAAAGGGTGGGGDTGEGRGSQTRMRRDTLDDDYGSDSGSASFSGSESYSGSESDSGSGSGSDLNPDNFTGDPLEFDFEVLSRTLAPYVLNKTDIDLRLAPITVDPNNSTANPDAILLGSTARWAILGRVLHPDNTNANSSAVILALDSEQEEKIGLGRNWPYRPLGEAEIHVSASVLRFLGVRPNRGERLQVGIDLTTLVSTFGLDKNPNFGMDSMNLSSVLRQVIKGALVTYLQSQDVNITVNLDQLLPLLGVPVPPVIPPFLRNITISTHDIPPALVDQIVDIIFDQVFVDQNSPFSNPVTSLVSGGQFFYECTVIDSVEDPDGKWPDSLGNVVVMESKYLPRIVKSLFPSNGVLLRSALQSAGIIAPNDTRTSINDALDSINLNQYALFMVVQYKDRYKTYIDEDLARKQEMIRVNNIVGVHLGVAAPISIQLPIYTTLQTVKYIKYFLDQVFAATVVVLIGLGVMLIYSLLLSDVEEKTYEYGMVRALGMQQNNLVQLLLIQSVMYAIPGIILGLFGAFILGIPVLYGIYYYATTPTDYSITNVALFLSISLGFFMPLIANVYPIKRALSRTLRDALDIYHQVSQETTVNFVKLETLGLSPWQVSLSVTMVVFGFVIYYLVPYCLIFENIPLFLTILNCILLGMVVGSAMIAVLIQPAFEKLTLKLLLWGNDRKLGVLVRKSLSGHRTRNQKTALMFTISLAFIIFAGAMFSLQLNAIQDNVKYGFGAPIVVWSPLDSNPLDRAGISGFLDKIKEKDNSTVVDYAFVSYQLYEEPSAQHQRLANLGGYLDSRVTVWAVDKSFLNSIYTEFSIPTEVCSQFEYQPVPSYPSKQDIVASLYDDAGKQVLAIEQEGIPIPPRIVSDHFFKPDFKYYLNTTQVYTTYIDIIMSEAMRYWDYLDTSRPIQFLQGVRYGTFIANVNYFAKARAMVKKMPGFFYSSYRETALESPVMISNTAYEEIASFIHDIDYQTQLIQGRDPSIRAPDGPPPAERLMIKSIDGATLQQREDIINGVRNFITKDLIFIFDVEILLQSTRMATTIILLFFNIIAVIATLLCFFGLWLSFTANVRENSWEFGVLRAVGLSGAQVIRVYIYEALCVVASAALLGSVIGALIALTLTLQSTLFTEMPFVFNFPTVLFFSVMIMALFVAVFGSYLPADKLRQKQIAIALRGA